MADWEEIKRLAADLQRAQLSGSAQRYVLFPNSMKMYGVAVVEKAIAETTKTYVPVSSVLLAHKRDWSCGKEFRCGAAVAISPIF